MSDFSRRQFFKLGLAAGGGLLLFRHGAPGRAFAATCAPPGCSPASLLPAQSIPKFQAPLVIPPAMPRTSVLHGHGGTKIDYYEIAVRQFDQQILPPGFPDTTVWSYGSVNHPGTFNYPAFTIEARVKRPVRVRWINDLKDAHGRFLPHLLPVDPTLHWANPPGGLYGRDSRPMFEETPGRYEGPVPIVTHLHGGELTPQESDGFPEAWFLPKACNIPAGFARTGTFYDYFKGTSPLGDKWSPGTAVFEYPNKQRASALWYHDHTLGMTRVNVYAGPAGFYLLRGGPSDLDPGILPGPAPAIGDPPGQRYFEIPLAIQDRSFCDTGALFYPDSRAFFDGFPGPYLPDTPVSPIWNPEFFGDTIVVNGRTWPFLKVEQRRYRFRILNGCDARFLILRLSNGLPLWVIGSDGGFLPNPVPVQELLVSPAQRFDVIVDFSCVPVGTTILVQNLGPDGPFSGGVPGQDFPPADPTTTGQVMELRVVPASGRDRSTPPHRLHLPALHPLGDACNTRQVSLNESMFTPGTPEFPDPIPVAVLLGQVAQTNAGAVGVPLFWEDEITENPSKGATEIWEIYNFTADAHPIHIHELQFQLVNRQALVDGQTVGPLLAPDPTETGFIDTVTALPGQVTRIKATFRREGLFVWHCHILEHEDNEMMRPYHIGPIPPGLPPI